MLSFIIEGMQLISFLIELRLNGILFFSISFIALLGPYPDTPGISSDLSPLIERTNGKYFAVNIPTLNLLYIYFNALFLSNTSKLITYLFVCLSIEKLVIHWIVLLTQDYI